MQNRFDVAVAAAALGLAAAAALAVPACQGETVGGLEPDIVVCVPPDVGADCTTPASPLLMFPETPAGGIPSRSTVVIRNRGLAPLQLRTGETRVVDGALAFG